MRVLMQARPNLFTRMGGDTVQLVQTKKALEEIGVQVDVSLDLAPALAGYDVVHLFNLKGAASTYLQATCARERGVPIVLSTIYWKKPFSCDASASERWDGAIPNVKAILRKSFLYPYLAGIKTIANGERWYPELIALRRTSQRHAEVDMQRRIVDYSAVLLPNSPSEYELVRRQFRVDKEYVVVPNGVEAEFDKAADDRLFRDKYGISDFVLCAARIEPRKNQLRLVQAIKQTPYELVLIGLARRPYARLCQSEARGGRVRFLGHIEGPMLVSAYHAGRVHVLPSWYETPGLANLEAALCGCSIVSTKEGSGFEYFGRHAEYCDPSDPSSIRGAIERAYVRPTSTELISRIRTQYSWRAAAESTLAGYRRALHIA